MRRLLIPVVVACALAAPASAGALGLPGREADPVVLTGAAVPGLLGADPGDVVAFAFDDDWQQVPVQVDERAMIDYAAVRNGHQTEGRPFSNLAYADAGTLAGPDPQPALDRDDEIAMMAMDSGMNAGDAADPAGVIRGSRVRVRIADPLRPDTERFIYLFRRNSADLDPSAGRAYVDYDFKLLSGDYRSTFDFDGVPNGDNGSGGPPANPEDSVVSTSHYRSHLFSRWIEDALNVRADGASGVDVLDGDKVQVNYSCGRAEVTFARGGGGFIANKSGPIRAIRSYIGANSGTYTQRDQIYYQRAEFDTTYLRVHPGINVISQFLDYSPAAIGMTYRNSTVPAGATIDGTPDPALETGNSPGPPFEWEQVSGPQGTLSIVNRMRTTLPGVVVGSYYQDDLTPTTSQCDGYADDQALGASGTAVTGTGQNTDPTLGDSYDFTARRAIFFSGPGGDATLAAQRSEQVDSPLRVTSAAAGPKARLELTPPSKPKRAEIGERTKLRVRIRNSGNVPAGPFNVCAKAPRKLVRTPRCRHVTGVDTGDHDRLSVHVWVVARRPAADRKTIRVKLTARGRSIEPARAKVRLKPR